MRLQAWFTILSIVSISVGCTQEREYSSNSTSTQVTILENEPSEESVIPSTSFAVRDVQEVDDVVRGLPIEVCRIVDISPRDLPLRSGFEDPFSGAVLRDFFSVGLVPLNFEGTPFTEDDGQLLDEVLDKAVTFLGTQTYGQVTFQFEMLEALPLTMTVEESKLTPFKHGANLQVLANSAWDSIVEQEYASGFDIIIFVVPFHQDVWIGKWEDIDVGRVYIMGGQYLKKWGPWAHEIGHAISVAEDLYTYLLSGLSDEFFQQWDIMDNAEGRNRDMNLWSRWLAGWIPDSSVVCIDDYARITLSGVNELSGRRLAVIPFNDHSALAVEFRDRGPYQSNPRTVLIYSIDTSVDPGWGQLRVVSTLLVPGQSFDSIGLNIELHAIDAGVATVEIQRTPSLLVP